MNLGKMIEVFCNNHDGHIIDIEKENNALNIYVQIKYLARNFGEKYNIMKYKIINFEKIELNVLAKKYEEIDEINNITLVIINAEVGKEHSLLINILVNGTSLGKLYIWAGKENDIKIYDQENNEIEYSKFNNYCRRK